MNVKMKLLGFYIVLLLIIQERNFQPFPDKTASWILTYMNIWITTTTAIDASHCLSSSVTNTPIAGAYLAPILPNASQSFPIILTQTKEAESESLTDLWNKSRVTKKHSVMQRAIITINSNESSTNLFPQYRGLMRMEIQILLHQDICKVKQTHTFIFSSTFIMVSTFDWLIKKKNDSQIGHHQENFNVFIQLKQEIPKNHIEGLYQQHNHAV